MRDIESRIMEIFKEKGGSESMVVDITLVKHVILIIGNPSIFGDRPTEDRDKNREYQYVLKRLIRNITLIM